MHNLPAKKGFNTCIKVVVSNGWWKKQSTAVSAACQLIAILAALNTGRKNKSLLPPRIYFWSYYQIFYVKYSSFVFSRPRCLSESWAVTRISKLLPRRQWDKQNDIQEIYKRKMSIWICCIHVINFSSLGFCLAWWEGVIMLICVHRNRCRRRENGLGWLSLPGKSISEIGNPSSGCPTTANYGQPHGFIAREGRRVFVVTEYWQEIQRRQLPRDRCSAREVVKHECKFCTSLVKCKTQMQRKPTIYSRHMQSKKLANYDFGKGYFGFSWKVFGIQKVWCLFICVIIRRQFVIRKRLQISGGRLPKLFWDSFPPKIMED